ncbi:hypothetical protein BWP39_02725 [Paraburkholderia acidicola]|uniref:Uncharacterized protein n=1 Tax=Paraburkholderia acidicola TaxID=1912599 RepID=A0A2A4F232_9BURK|nr:hypothetical protein [Paraburkholderia acidicola]PCE27431.1 hypothetical protein BWP39_02725 [Paraburkholderia acidicola]
MSAAADEAGIGMLVLIATFIAICILAVSITRSVSFILSSRDGRNERVNQIVKVSVRRTIVGICALAALASAWTYWEGARLRALVKPTDCDNAQSADGRYTARVCYLGSRIVLRLYERQSQQLLAERTYGSSADDPVRLYWKPDELRYEDGADLGTIHLPPSLYDRLLAKLP